jgi:hypothetical protein
MGSAMRKLSQTSFPPEESVEQIKAHVELGLVQLKLFRLKTEAFERYVEEAAVHLKSAQRHAQVLK